MRRIGDEYRAQGSLAAGREVLLGYGCPPSIVGAGTHGSYASAPASSTGYRGTSSLPPGSQARRDAEAAAVAEREQRERALSELVARDDAWTGYRAVTDEFTGEVEHRVQARFNDRPLEMAAVRVAPHEPDAAIVLRFFDERARYASCHSTHGLADANRLPLTDATYASGDESVGVIETVTVRVSLDALRTIAAAQLVRFRVCTDVVQMPDGFSADVAALVEAIGGPTAPGALLDAQPDAGLAEH